MEIGGSQKKRMDNFRGTLADLQKISTPEFAAAFADQRAKIDNWTARIAAVGQVKAGKSSVLNALVGQANFLPSDVNPWTSVVTNMRINVKGDPKSGAVFEFFDEGSWDRIINGNPKMRAMAEKYLPGFDADLLRRQTSEMRERAQRRLGRFYSTLLGSKHEYDILSPQLLERYVCAGPGADDGLEGEALGRYAALTKVANIFLRSPDFVVPSIVTDTPGVNDPFLVRDEFTCQSLSESDIFLVTLSAHQALTEVDIALIRMLAAQGSKEVILYINRIDEMDDYPDRVKDIIKDVSGRIARAIPGREFRVVVGSAYWAELVMQETPDEKEIARIANDPRMAEFLATWRNGVSGSPRERLLAASGIEDIKQCLSDAIDDGVGARFMSDVVNETKAQINALKVVSNQMKHQLENQIESFGSGQLAEYEASLRKEQKTLEDVRSDLEALVSKVDFKLYTAMNASWSALRRQIDHDTGDFIQNQRSVILEMSRAESESSLNRLEIDILPLREAIENGARESYDSMRENVDKILSEALIQSDDIVARVLDGNGPQVSLDGLPGGDLLAAFATPRNTLSVNMVSKRGWAFWRKNELDIDQTIDVLKKVTTVELSQSTDMLLELFSRNMAIRVQAGKDRMKLVLKVIEKTLEDRNARLQEERDMSVVSDDGAGLQGRIMKRLRNDVGKIDDNLHMLAAAESELSKPKYAPAA